MDNIILIDNTQAGRFELQKDGVTAAFADYTLQPGLLTLTHTESLPQFAGQGLASQLATFALGEVRRRGLKAASECSFFTGYINKHAQYQDLLA
jgi:predicted GNAT family acetyltransferase